MEVFYIKNISVDQLHIMIPNIKIIDIRDNYLYNISHIETAINIPMNKLLLYPEKMLNRYDTYYIYCEYGNSSQITCRRLLINGFNVVNIVGGYDAYKRMF